MINIIVLALVLFAMLEFWAFAVSILLLMLIILVQRSEIRESFRVVSIIDKKRRKQLSLVSRKLDEFVVAIDKVRKEICKDMFAIENRITWSKSDYKLEMERNYRELARKILEVENKLSKTRRTIAAALGSLDERIGEIEKKRKT